MLKNLKIKISMSLFGLLAIGMLLLSFVIIAFWYKNITKLEKAHIQYILQFEKEKFQSEQPEREKFFADLHGRNVGTLALSGSLPGMYADLKKSIKITLVYFLVNAIILTVIGFYRMVDLVIRPLEQLVQLADHSVGVSDTETFFRADNNEFGQLAFRLRQLIKKREEDNEALRVTVASLQRSNEELQKAGKKVERAEKLASVGRLSAGLAHEIGNPLGIVKGYVEMLECKDITAEDRRQFAARAGKEVVRIETIVRQLLDFTRQSEVRLTSVSLDAVLGELLTLFKDRKFRHTIAYTDQGLKPGVTVIADYESLRQVFLNCFLNSIDAIEEKGDPSAGIISVVISPGQDQALHNFAVVTISDNGIGIDPQQLDNVFDPFFTTKEPGKGTGLGLAVSYTLIEQCGGRMSLQNNVEGGASVSIELPCAKESSLSLAAQ